MPEYTSKECKAAAWVWIATNYFLNLKLFCTVTYQVCKYACFMLNKFYKQSLQLL